MSRRTRQRRTRPRRDKGQGVSPPARSMAQAKEYQWTERDVEQLKELHAARSWQAQRTDEALVATIAPSPGHWIKTPGEYDVHGVDYPELKTPKAKRDLEPHERMKEIEAKPPRVDDQKISANPMGSPDAAKKYLADVVEEYRRKLGIKGEVKLSAQNRGAPARIRHYKDGKTPQIEVNYSHFADLWTDAPELTQKYLEYGIAHELAHQRQYEDLGHRGYQKAFTKAKAEGEWDADGKALSAMGITRKELEGSLDQLAKKVNGVHETAHQPFKGTPNIERFKDTTPPEKPKAASTRDQMRATYIKALGGIIPTANQEEIAKVTEKAMTEEWIKPDDDVKSAMSRVTEKAKAELVKLRQAKAHLERDEQLKRLKELHEKAEAKTSDEERHWQRLAQLREDYGGQYDTALNAAMDINVKGYSRKLHQDLRNMGYSYTEAAEIGSSFDESFINRIHGEALQKRRQDSMEAARDAFGEAPELWEDAVKKYMATDVAQRAIPGMVEAAYKEALGSVRDRTKPPEPVTPIIPKKPTVKTSTESYDFYADPGHGWLRAPLKRLEALGIENDISPYSYVKGGYAYLEEDRDAQIFTQALESEGVKVGLREHTANRESSIRGYQPYKRDDINAFGKAKYDKARSMILEADKPAKVEYLLKLVNRDQGLTKAERAELAEYGKARVAQLSEKPESPSGAQMSPTEEARRRYDETMADRIPRMAKTWRLNLGRALTDQGFTVEEAEKYMDRLTAEAAQRAHAEFFAENRIYAGVIAEQIIQRPEIVAERDALTVVQNEYEKLKKEALGTKKPAPAKDEVVIDIPDKKPAATYDAETEKIIKRIMDEKEVSRVLVEKRIEEEKAQKAGLITNEAAATLVAYEMLGEPVGKTAWAKISMNQMGGYFRVNEYSPTLDKVLHDNVAFKTREEAQAYVDRVNNPAGSETLPSLKKATAFSPEFNKESGMYEVEVYNPETRRKSRKQFSTPDKAEQYQKLVNDNPGWPTEGFKERLGSKQGLPMHLITAENSKSRGDEALKYDVYERLPPNAKRGDKYVDDRYYKYVASGTTEYKEAPGKEKLVEDLAKEYLNKGSVEVEFSPNPHWTPALSQIDRVEPGRPGYYEGKCRVLFTNRDGRGDKRDEGNGERWFDTYEEALDFIRDGRGRYEQRGVQREGIWTQMPEPPQLPKELESFLGKQSKFLVDPRPRYEGAWNSDLKREEHRWVFENQIGQKTYTLDELKAEQLKGEWKTRDRAEAAKSSKTITRKKGMSSKAWDHAAQPLASAVIFTQNAVIEADGNTVAYEGMDVSHVALLKLKVPNDMGIPEGKYEVADFNLDKRVTHRRHPKKLEWDNVERTLTIGNENQKSYIRYEKVHEYQNRFPIPRVGFDAKIKLDMKELAKVADNLDRKGGLHVKLKVSEGRSALDSSFTYECEMDEKQMVTHGEGADAWETEENVKVPVSGTVGEVEKADKDEVKAVYTTSYLSDHLGSLVRAGFRDATLEYAEDMPLKITATRDDGAYAEFWLAPCIGV